MFVTSQGSAHGRFQRACDNGNVEQAERAALELDKPVAMINALALVRLYAVTGSPKFERAALRWLNRLIDEGDLALSEVRRTVEWLEQLAGPDAELAAGSLGKFAYRRRATTPI